MNFSKIKKSLSKNMGSALMHMALIASPLTMSGAANAYYASRRGNYSSRNNTYLIDESLASLARGKHLRKSTHRLGNMVTAKHHVKEVSDISKYKHEAISELVIIDRNIQNYEQFAKLRKPGVEVIEIPKEIEGLSFLLDEIGKYSSLKAIHLFSHATSGQLQLGNQTVDQNSLNNNIQAFNILNNSIVEGGDLLLYGCELAKEQEGDDFLEIIKNNTHVDVAASNDKSGNAEYGGNWDLEIQKGNIEAKPLANSIALKDFTQVLQSYTFDFNSYDYDGDIVNGGGTTAADNVVLTESGSSNYSLVVNGYSIGTTTNYRDYCYMGYDGGSGTETTVTLFFSGGETFDPTSLKITNWSSGNRIFTFTSDVSGSTTSSSLANGGSETVDLSSLAPNTSVLTITADASFKGGLDDFVASNITLSVLNTAPSLSLQDTELSTNSASAITFNSGNNNLISITDGESDDQSVTISVAGGGTFFLSGTSGLTVSGNGTSNVTLSGSLANVNNALNGAYFHPASNVGQHVISISTSDGTNTDGPDDITIGVYPASTTLTKESFESFTNLDTDFNNSVTNQTFSFTASTFTVTEYTGLGIGGSDFLIDNVNNCSSSGSLSASFLIANNQEFYVKSFWLFPSEDCAVNGTNGSVTIRGKNNNATQFTKTITSGELNNDQGINEGFTFISMDAFAGYTIDELEFETSGSISYVGIDDFEFAAEVYNPNSVPTFNSSATASFAENTSTSTVVLDVNADNGDGGANDTGITYSLASGGDNDLFNINSSNGQITFRTSPDYETPADNGSNNIYDITVTADDGEVSNNTSDQNITITVTDVDEAAPLFENGRPSIANIAGSSFNLNIDIDEAGTVYYVVLADGATAPTSAEVKAGTASGGGSVDASGSQTLNSGGFTHSFSVTGLTSETAYDVYVVAEDDETIPNLQASTTKLDINTSDITAPSYENGRPSIANIAGSSFNLNIDIDEAGTVYYVVLADGAIAPTSAEVKAGTASGGGSVEASGSQTLNSGGFTHSFSVTGLSTATAYDVYVLAEDDEGTPNLQTSPRKLDVNTLAVPGLTIAESGGATITAESGSTDDFTLVLDAQPATDVVVDISSGDTGEGTVDKNSLTFTSSNWNTPQTVTVSGVDDDIIDGTISYNIFLSINDASSDDDYDGLADKTVSVNNSDNDVAGFTVAESGGSTTTSEIGNTDDFTIVLDAEPASDVVISISSGDTGEGTADKSSLTFTSNNWHTPQTVTLTGVDDDIIDGTQTFNVTLSVDDANSDDNFDAIGDKTISVNNSDDDVAGFTVIESGGSTSTSEAGTTDDFTVVLDAEPASNVVVNVSSGDTSEGTVSTANLTFTTANWDIPQTVTITGVDDSDLDGDVSYNITLSIDDVSSDDDFDALGDKTVAVFNADDDGVQITIDDPVVSEGDNGSLTLTFTVSLSAAAPDGGITVDYATSNGTAASGRDYTSASGTLSFAVGESSKTIGVTIAGDEIVEVDETLTVTLSNNTGDSEISDATGTGTITNDDAAAVTIADISGNEDDGTVTLTATLDHAVQGGFTVDVSTADGTATVANGDYVPVSSETLTFAGTAGETQSFTVSLMADAKLEKDETIIISQSNLSNSPMGVAISDGAIITINNDDAASVTIADISSDEDMGAITVTATLDNPVDGGFSVDVSTVDGTTSPGVDYAPIAGETLTFAGTAGEAQTFTIIPIADQVVESDETLTVSMSNLSTALDVDIAEGATVTLINDDHAPVITVGQNFSLAEDATNSTLVGEVLATDADGATIFKNWSITAGNDAGIFGLNENTGEIKVHDQTQLDYESATSYTLKLRVSDGDNSSSEETVQIKITDANDNAPVITASQSFTIGEAAAGGTAVGSVLFTDLDENTSVQDWTIRTGNADVDADSKTAFTINSTTGELTVLDSDEITGGTSFTLELSVSDGVNTSATETLSVQVVKINDAPTFTKGADQSILEDAGAQSVTNWATDISAGSADEADQTLTFQVSNDNEALFKVQPSISAAGTLSYTPAEDANGTAKVTVVLSDDGGTENGGKDTSEPVNFTITISPVNDAPFFTVGSDQTVAAGAGSYTISGWASGIAAGPANESSQEVSFQLSNDHEEFFSAQPAVNRQGDLSFAIADGVSGDVTVSLSLSDDGGTANGGIDTGKEASFTISIAKLPQQISFAEIDDKKVGQNPITLNATGGNSGNPVTYSLITEPASGVASLEGNLLVMEGLGLVTVIASQAGNDTYQAAQDVSVSFTIKQNELFLPTLFSPNGDQNNDFFILRGAGGVASIEMTIYNREGEQVYRSTDFESITQKGWDGTYQGQALIPGNYVWVLKGSYTNGEPLTVNGKNTGAIRLIR